MRNRVMNDDILSYRAKMSQDLLDYRNIHAMNHISKTLTVQQVFVC